MVSNTEGERDVFINRQLRRCGGESQPVVTDGAIELEVGERCHTVFECHNLGAAKGSAVAHGGHIDARIRTTGYRVVVAVFQGDNRLRGEVNARTDASRRTHYQVIGRGVGHTEVVAQSAREVARGE